MTEVPPQKPPMTVEELLLTPKTIGKIRRASDPSCARLEVEVLSEALPGDPTFRMFVRIMTRLSENFSLGLLVTFPGDRPTTLLRVNGDHGTHGSGYGPDRGWFSGPHVHGHMAPTRGKPPRPGAKPKAAWPIGPEHVSVLAGWRMFRGLATVAESSTLDTRLRKILREIEPLVPPPAVQLKLPLPETDQ